MATNLTKTTFDTTYKDDFTDTDNYHKILFNSGRILQARELTQAQTILQKQIERFGNNIFKEGAVVKAGGIIFNNAYEFIKLNTTSNALPSDTSTLVGTTFASQDGKDIQAEVIEVVDASGSDPATLYVRYVKTSGATASADSIRMPNAVNINNGSITLTTATTGAAGTGIRAHVNSGIFYIKGHFVFTEDQNLIVSKYTDDFTGDVGFKVIEDVVTADDDEGLFDNQGAVSNTAAPGADRYRIRLTLSKKDDITGSENFVFLARLKNGGVEKIADQADPFNVPSKVTAQRIHENSGDYVVNPFTAQFTLDSASTHLLLDVSDGIAVINGNRVSRNPSQIRVAKSQSTFTVNNETTVFSLGNYVKVSGSNGNTAGLPNISNFESLSIQSAADFGGSKIGTARVRAITEDGANFRFYLFDVVMNAGQAFSSAKSIGTSANNYFDIILEGTPAVAELHETNLNTAIYDMTNSRPSNVENIILTTQRYAGSISVTPAGSGGVGDGVTGTMPPLSGSETYTNTGDWVIAKNDSDVFTGSRTFTGSGTNSVTFQLDSSAQGTYEVIYYVKNTSGSIRSKTLTTIDSEGVTMSTDSDGLRVLSLSKADIFDVIEIRDSDPTSSVDISSRFIFDNGQRDNFYDVGRLILKSGQSEPPGNVKVKYRYFDHGGTGNFFTINSYDSDEVGGYKNIPLYTATGGRVYDLASSFDFRSVKSATPGQFSSVIHELPQPGDTITSNNSYYFQQAGKLVLDADGVLTFVRGDVGSRVRTFPTAPANTMALHDIVLGANTLDDSDVLITPVQNKRFTMKDIGTLEKRVERLEEAVTLSFLEVNTKNFEVLDSSGNNRTRSGLIADNFDDQLFTDTVDENYAAAIDPFVGVLHPTFNEDNIRLVFDNSASTNVVLKGDNVYIDYDSAEYLDASKASTTVKINPFDYAQYNGLMVLSPSSDEWRDTKNVTGKVTNGGTQLDTKQAYLWNNHNWNWGGTPIDKLTVGSRTSQTFNSTFNKVISDEKVRKVVNERIIDTVLIPFQRQKKIFFKAGGLRPNTQHFAFYDRYDVSSWVREETFVRYASTNTDFGNKHKNATSHPEGSGLLVSDGNGVIEGSFFVEAGKYRTGTREFALIDVTAYTKEFAKSNSRAVANFTSIGQLEINEQDIINTRVITVKAEKVPQRVHTRRDDNDRNNSGAKHYQVGTSGTFRTKERSRQIAAADHAAYRPGGGGMTRTSRDRDIR